MQLEEFIQKHVRYDKAIPNNDLMRTIAQKSRHRIIVSHIKSPREMQIQLAENEAALNSLMDDLEKVKKNSLKVECEARYLFLISFSFSFFVFFIFSFRPMSV